MGLGYSAVDCGIMVAWRQVGQIADGGTVWLATFMYCYVAIHRRSWLLNRRNLLEEDLGPS